MAKKLSTYFLILLCGAAIGRFLFPPQPKIETVEKIIEKVQTVEVVKEQISKDGTTVRITERTINENKTQNKVVKINKDEWSLSIQYGLAKDPLYGLQIEKRVFDNFKLGAWGNTQGQFGLSLGVTF